ncbi:hypothetical protein GM415_00875 [Pseudodesulfovibrio cashew]|uniref:Uncharacterized protein n=1 Tax=Pseudodesulfovibrio cashew TaxID=2678688 RepID=A0A6I6J9P4_9BACT|nr:hypothetical protein [Pseudodesulfovibrio cashew]QGY38751.1 hypothetical protein GM415_00875 [Pseudodesulfovibrio cashew]
MWKTTLVGMAVVRNFAFSPTHIFRFLLIASKEKHFFTVERIPWSDDSKEKLRRIFIGQSVRRNGAGGPFGAVSLAIGPNKRHSPVPNLRENRFGLPPLIRMQGGRFG